MILIRPFKESWTCHLAMCKDMQSPAWQPCLFHTNTMLTARWSGQFTSNHGKDRERQSMTQSISNTMESMNQLTHFILSFCFSTWNSSKQVNTIPVDIYTQSPVHFWDDLWKRCLFWQRCLFAPFYPWDRACQIDTRIIIGSAWEDGATEELFWHISLVYCCFRSLVGLLGYGDVRTYGWL